MRRNDSQWFTRLTEWPPRDRIRSRIGPFTWLKDETIKFGGKEWAGALDDRGSWKGIREAFVLQRTQPGWWWRWYCLLKLSAHFILADICEIAAHPTSNRCHLLLPLCPPLPPSPGFFYCVQEQCPFSTGYKPTMKTHLWGTCILTLSIFMASCFS